MANRMTALGAKTRTAALAALALALSTIPAAAEAVKLSTGLPVPRFVTLKAKKINLRVGPGQDYAVSWRYLKSGLPVEITQEFENWRRIRDAEGAEGWIYHSLLSGRRTGVITPWESDDKAYPMLSSQAEGRIVANLKPNVVVSINHCDSQWCEIAARGYEGYVPQKDIWGVYPGEVVDN